MSVSFFSSFVHDVQALAGAIGQVVSGQASKSVTAPVQQAHDPEQLPIDDDAQMGTTHQDATVGVKQGTHSGSNRRVRFTKSALGGDTGDDSEEEAGSSAWGTTRSGGPVVVIPGTNKAVDALLTMSRDDLPVVRQSCIAAISQIYFPSVSQLIVTHHATLKVCAAAG